jgi:hypothetical protein
METSILQQIAKEECNQGDRDYQFTGIATEQNK